MKKLLLFFSLFFLLGFHGYESPDTHKQPYKSIQASFEWLLGSWKRINDKEGMQTYEYWEKLSETEFDGKGYTLKEGDTVWQERIKLMKREGSWKFEVTDPKSSETTIFGLTKIETNSFTCENLDNDFPKKIRYAKVEKGLNAVISGDGKVVLFEFMKLP